MVWWNLRILGENFAGLAIAAFTAARELESSMSRPLASSTMETVFTFSVFYEENSSQYNYCCNDQDPFGKKKSSEEIFLLQLLFFVSLLFFSYSESFPCSFGKNYTRYDWEIQDVKNCFWKFNFQIWKKGAIFFFLDSVWPGLLKNIIYRMKKEEKTC